MPRRICCLRRSRSGGSAIVKLVIFWKVNLTRNDFDIDRIK